jgi:lipopolysaccharide export system permease protein
MKLSKLYFFPLWFSNLSVLDRYLLTELTSIFIFSVGIFSSVGVAVGTLSDLANKISDFNLPLIVAIQVFILKIPEYAGYALPISLLLATLMTYGRLSSDSEMIALRSFGISVYRLVAPAIIFSLLITTISFLFNELVVPVANYQATFIQNPFIPDERTSTQKQDIFYPEYEQVESNKGVQKQTIKSFFYAQEFDGKNLKNLTVINWSNHQIRRIIIAELANWDRDQKVWNFYRGFVYQVNQKSLDRSDNILPFDRQQFSLSKIPLDLVKEARDPYEMNIAQGFKYLELLKFSQDEKKILMLEVRIQQKFAFPFICLIFGIVGSALGASSQDINKTRSFGLSVIVVFLYYLLGFLIGALGLIGVISPFWAAWLPNFLGLGMGWKLLVRASNGV